MTRLQSLKAAFDNAQATGNYGAMNAISAEMSNVKTQIESDIANFKPVEIQFDSTSAEKSATKAGKSAAESYVSAFQKELQEWKDLESQGKISHKQYLDALLRLVKKYFGDRKKYAKEYAQYMDEYLQGYLDLYNKALSGISTLLNQKINAANEAKDAAVSALQEEKEKAAEVYQSQIDNIEKEKEAIDDLIKEKNKKIDSLNEEAEAIRKASEERKRDIELQDAQRRKASISDGLEQIDGQEVECTITVNVKMNGSFPQFADGTAFGQMQIESATYNAQYGKAFASGTIGLPKAEKNALVSEYGQTEMTVLPNGKTIVTDEPTLMDLPKDTVIYNEEQTKKIMDNKVDISGNAHANGTTNGEIVLADGTVIIPYDPDKDDSSFSKLYKAWNARYGNIDKNVDDIQKTLSNHLAIEHSQKMNEEVNRFVNNSNSIVNNNKNVQPVVHQNVTINCPNVTNESGAENIRKDLSTLSLKALQVDW